MCRIGRQRGISEIECKRCEKRVYVSLGKQRGDGNKAGQLAMNCGEFGRDTDVKNVVNLRLLRGDKHNEGDEVQVGVHQVVDSLRQVDTGMGIQVKVADGNSR